MEKEAVKYELRELGAQDIFSMSRIIKKIGVASFKKCFDTDAIKTLVNNYAKGDKKEESKVDNVVAIGVEVAFEIADVIFERLPECEQELYAFLSAVSELTVPEVKKLSPADFLGMIIEVIKKPEFKDFFKVASRLFS